LVTARILMPNGGHHLAAECDRVEKETMAVAQVDGCVGQRDKGQPNGPLTDCLL
jgi:hypothetical protein